MVSGNHYYRVSFWTNLLDLKFFVNLKEFILKKFKKNVLNTITFSLEHDNNEVNFKEETLTFKLHLLII